MKVANQIIAIIQKLRAPNRLAPKALLAALAELAFAFDVVRDATKDAADKTAAAAAKHAAAVKAAAEKQKQAAEDAANKLRDATQRARDQIGDLFQGPLLAPTETQRKLAATDPAATRPPPPTRSPGRPATSAPPERTAPAGGGDSNITIPTRATRVTSGQTQRSQPP